ncbi:MAG: PIN domain-containing protein [Candidatus Solibacter sp.]
MSGIAFFDTNVLVYADDQESPEKQELAINLQLRYRPQNEMAVSLQVLQEYYNTLTRKLGIAPEIVQRKVELLGRARVVAFNVADIIASIELHRLHRVSFWDAMILHAARVSRASILYTEDLQHGSVIAGVSIVNPFLNS